MERFRRRYIQLCKKRNVDVSDSVLSCLSRSVSSDDYLDLSACNLSDSDCSVIGKCLSEDSFFTSINFTDCLLTESCCQMLLRSLCSNNVVRKLNFKGNNVRLSGAEEISKLLKQTKYLAHLSIEWNALGMWEMGVRAIAEGLALNQTLIYLDLRNNQISHESVTDLAAALRKNKMLRALDLRWNNAGIIGARALVGTLKHNATLLQLKLSGNNVPNDILQNISTLLARNSERHAAQEKQESLTSTMRNEMVALEEVQKLQVSNLTAQLSQERLFQESLSNSTQEKIGNLKSVLEERRAVAEKLSDKCRAAEKALELAKLAIAEKDQQIEKFLSDSQAKQQRFDETLKVHEKSRFGLEQQLSAVTDENKAIILQNKPIIVELESKLAAKTSEVNSLQARLQEQDKEFANQIQTMKEQFHKDRDFFRSSSEEKVQELQGKVARLEKELEKKEAAFENFRIKTLSEKAKLEEEFGTSRARFREEEAVKAKEHLEKSTALQRAKEELELKSKLALTEVNDLKSQVANYTREIQTLSRSNDSLKHEASQLQQTYKHETDRLKADLDSSKRQNLEISGKFALLETTQRELNSKLASLRNEKDDDIAKLQKSLHSRDLELLNLREDEVRRAGMLQSAIQNYITSSRSPVK